MSQIHKEEIEDTIKKHKVVIFAKSWCPFCTEASIILQSHGVMDLKVVEADHCPDELEFMNALKGMTELKTVPQIFVDGKIIPGDKPGCFDRLDALREKDALKPLLSEAPSITTCSSWEVALAARQQLSRLQGTFSSEWQWLIS